MPILFELRVGSWGWRDTKQQMAAGREYLGKLYTGFDPNTGTACSLAKKDVNFSFRSWLQQQIAVANDEEAVV